MSLAYTVNEEKVNNSGLKSKNITKQEISDLKARDNFTNLLYIGQVYLIIFSTIAITIMSYYWVADAGLGWWWNIPMTALAVAIIGASQHQFGGIVHEGTHYILFKNRKMSELASDWLGAFPLYTSTYAFRLHHLAHHQFVNDPERDPNFNQAHDSGHWLDFPLTHIELVWGILKLLLPTTLVSFIIARLRYSALGNDHNPYMNKDTYGVKCVAGAFVIFAIINPVLFSIFTYIDHMYPNAHDGYIITAGVICAVMYIGTITFFLLVPSSWFPSSVINTVISHRATMISRTTYLAIIYGSLIYLQYATGIPGWSYYLIFWVLPLFSTFPLFMVLREWVQHGNADRGRYTNSRVLLVGPFMRYAIFPFGQDYHLPHHIYASVPHYKLKDLHGLLAKKDDKYAEQMDKGMVVENWVKFDKKKEEYPSIVDVLGHEYSPKFEEVHFDPSVLEHADLNDKETVERHIEASKHNKRTDTN